MSTQVSFESSEEVIEFVYLKIPISVVLKSCYLVSVGHCFGRLDKTLELGCTTVNSSNLLDPSEEEEEEEEVI